MGKKKNREMLFWIKDEYLKFADVMMDKPMSYYAFEMLYWTGIREGELLALTPNDFDFEKRTVTINKSYQRLNGRDLITTPKTEKSNRTITIPKFLAEEIQDYLGLLYGVGEDERMFTVTKSYLHREMNGEEPKVIAIHAGLECGLFKEQIPDLDIISNGPNCKDIHTPDETLDLNSYARVWKFLLRLLSEMK